MSPKKTSFPKQDIRVLLLEGVSQTAVEVFSAAGSEIPNPVQQMVRLLATPLTGGSPLQ